MTIEDLKREINELEATIESEKRDLDNLGDLLYALENNLAVEKYADTRNLEHWSPLWEKSEGEFE